MALNVNDLLQIKGVKIINEESIRKAGFESVSIDSRKCKAKDLFFAIKGEKFDGHDFTGEVLKKAKCAVVEKKWFQKLSGKEKRSFKNRSLVIVDNTVKVLGELANIYRRKFVIPVIAVGGSNGKTTTKDIIAYVLSKKYNVLKTEGNLNNELGLPLTLFKLKSDHEIAVIEIGTNHFDEINRLCRITEPQFGLITNIGKEHLEFLENIRGVVKAEGELVSYLQSRFGTVFLNTDDKYLKPVALKKNIKVFTYGSSGKVDVKGRINGFKGFYPEIEISYLNKKIKTQLNTIGNQSYFSALSASAVGFYFEVPVNLIKTALRKYEHDSGKRNNLKNINGVWIIDDTYNSNPGSVGPALENMKAFRIKGRKFIVLGDMLELGKSSKKEHREIGKLVRKLKFENLYTYGKDSFETFLAAKGIKNNFHFSDKRSLTEFLKLNLKKGDAALIKGSRSMKMEEVLEGLSQ